MPTLAELNARGTGYLPGYLGIVFTHLAQGEIRSELAIKPLHMAPNGFLHAGTIITLADTSAGYGCVAHMPPQASGFTTLEIKSNHLGTAREGTLACTATAQHLGKSTQVWDATVAHKESGKTIALFRCTQLILYAK